MGLIGCGLPLFSMLGIYTQFAHTGFRCSTLGIDGRVVGVGTDGSVSLGDDGDGGMEVDISLTGDRDKDLSQSSLYSKKVTWKDSVTLWDGL
jgi:hypothetical protein